MSHGRNIGEFHSTKNVSNIFFLLSSPSFPKKDHSLARMRPIVMEKDAEAKGDDRGRGSGLARSPLGSLSCCGQISYLAPLSALCSVWKLKI